MNYFLKSLKINKLTTMATFEEELKRLEPIIRRVTNFALIGKKIVVKGQENFVREGPNIIIGNHCGAFKDGGALLKIVPRPIFFTVNKMVFNKKDFNLLIRKHLKRHLNNFGLFVDLILGPIKSLFVNYFSDNVSKAGSIPVDMDQSKRMAIEQCQKYLTEGRAIITLQGRGRVMKREPNPYVSSFKRGTSIISYNLFKKDGISVPVTPVALFGTHIPFMIPGKIKINVGKPMFITDYLASGFTETVESFRSALENKVKALLLDILKW
ncbi:MAG: hypothetical protein H8E54_05120 [Candidatus Aminicenantes bacterium]|nr:hypothetical protein [Candidatus Aminicenantes bacterium]